MTARQEVHSTQSRTEHAPTAVAFFWIILIACLLFAIRFCSPDNLMDNDQQRPAAYALDAMVNGNWVVQRDDTGDVMSKPPFSTWLTALSAKAFGGLTRFSLYLPSFLASLFIALLILAGGTRYFGRAVGWWSALFYLFSPVFDHQILLNRSDPVFAAMVFAGALTAFTALRLRKSWIPFWLLMVCATLTKGPLALILAGGGLFVIFWDKSLDRRVLFAKSQWLGLLIYVVLGLGWFFAAYMELGQPLIDKMIGKELVGHAVGKGAIGAKFYQPLIFFMVLLLPWSFFAIGGMIQTFRNPHENAESKSFQRFLVLCLLVSLTLFGLATHHRDVHLYPIIPMAAILAGCFWVRVTHQINSKKLQVGFALVCFILLAFLNVQRFTDALKNKSVIETAQVREIAQELKRFGFPERGIIHHNTPFAIQFNWGTMQMRVTQEQAAAALEADSPSFVLTREPSVFTTLVADPANRVVLRQWPLAQHKGLYLLSNQPVLDLP
ncbi:MAG: ArnT family glycosyltransferase [Sumerlaeia bacterium]